MSAKLTGANDGELNLRYAGLLDESPLRYDTYANLRFWRFGARAVYSNAETRTRRVNGGRVDFSGLILGGDFDAVQFQWLTLGTSVDFYFINPTIQGVFVANPVNNSSYLTSETVNLRGDRPITWGSYLRYVPPEILGFPVHLEARYIVPLNGSKLTIYGASLAFRPQIYRFDLSCKVIVEKNHLKFQDNAQIQLFNVTTDKSGNTALTAVNTLPQNWELDMEWKYFGVEFAVYF
ncbi:MAG: hypothetical protein ACLP5H_27795 [Desulfomonilaceae bacterium]